MRHGIIDEPREGKRTIVLVSPVLEADFTPEDGGWKLLAVERTDDDAHLEAETDDLKLEVRIAEGEVRVRVTQKTGEPALTLRVA